MRKALAAQLKQDVDNGLASEHVAPTERHETHHTEARQHSSQRS